MKTYLDPPVYEDSRKQLQSNYISEYHQISPFKGTFFASSFKRMTEQTDREHRRDNKIFGVSLVLFIFVLVSIASTFYKFKKREIDRKLGNSKSWFYWELLMLKLSHISLNLGSRLTENPEQENNVEFYRKFLDLIERLSRADLDLVLALKKDPEKCNKKHIQAHTDRWFHKSTKVTTEIKWSISLLEQLLRIQKIKPIFDESNLGPLIQRKIAKSLLIYFKRISE